MSRNRDEALESAEEFQRRFAVWLCLLFGALYFVQGMAEPTEGLIAQPLRSLQSQWGKTTGQIASFAAIMAIPWSIKPIFGPIIDFVPFFGMGKRGYLMLRALCTSSVFVTLFAIRSEMEFSSWLLPLLIISTTAVAMGDVAVDALMVQYGQPLGLTGKLQSVQWSCIYAASFVAGPIGGELCQQNLQAYAFLIAGVLSGCSLLLLIYWRPRFVVVDPGIHVEVDDGVVAINVNPPRFSLWMTLAFLVLWSFNPFSSIVQYSFMKDYLGFDERFIGINTSAFAAGAFVASIGYGLYCRRVPFERLLRLSVIAGVAATLAYLGMVGKTSAIFVSIGAGAAYMTGTLIQLDLAARACPPKVAGTVFSCLMAASNFSIQISTYVGGWIFTELSLAWTPGSVFRFLVVLGAATSSLCWLLIKRLSQGQP